MEEKFINQGTIGQFVYGDVHIQQFCMPGAQVFTAASPSAEPSPAGSPDIHREETYFCPSEENAISYEAQDDSAASTPLPRELATEKARRVMGGLQGIGVLDAAFQPIGMSWAERGYLAQQVAFKLGIENQWKVFGELWHCSASSLRSGYNRAKDMPKMGDFDVKIKKIMR